MYQLEEFEQQLKQVSELFEVLMAEPERMPGDHQAQIPTEGLARTVADYIAGMTDRYAIREHHRIFRMGDQL